MMQFSSYRVEKGFSSHCDVEGDIEVGLITTSVELHIPKIQISISLNIWGKNQSNSKYQISGHKKEGALV